MCSSCTSYRASCMSYIKHPVCRMEHPAHLKYPYRVCPSRHHANQTLYHAHWTFKKPGKNVQKQKSKSNCCLFCLFEYCPVWFHLRLTFYHLTDHLRRLRKKSNNCLIYTTKTRITVNNQNINDKKRHFDGQRFDLFLFMIEPQAWLVWSFVDLCHLNNWSTRFIYTLPEVQLFLFIYLNNIWFLLDND